MTTGIAYTDQHTGETGWMEFTTHFRTFGSIRTLQYLE